MKKIKPQSTSDPKRKGNSMYKLIELSSNLVSTTDEDSEQFRLGSDHCLT